MLTLTTSTREIIQLVSQGRSGAQDCICTMREHLDPGYGLGSACGSQAYPFIKAKMDDDSQSSELTSHSFHPVN